jgi:hypothetical protein
MHYILKRYFLVFHKKLVNKLLKDLHNIKLKRITVHDMWTSNRKFTIGYRLGIIELFRVRSHVYEMKNDMQLCG